MNLNNNTTEKKKICVISTVSFTIRDYLAQTINDLSSHYDICVLTNCEGDALKGVLTKSVELIHFPFKRKINLISDATSLIRLLFFFRSRRFHIVFSIMPKSNLLAMLAAYVTFIPIRLNVFTAQTWVTRNGISAKILKKLDKIIATFASHSFVDSTSQRDFLLKKGIIKKEKTSVLANGSLGGVDLNKFRRNEKVRTCMRKKLNLTDDDIAILYMSRLTRTKGAWVVGDVFPAIAGISKQAHLIVVGPEEEQGARRHIKESCAACKNQLHIHDRTNTPEDFFSMADILWLPSLNEGFGLVVINAAAAGIPSIGSDIYGLQDSISNEETGLLHKAADKNDIVRTFNRILHNQTLRIALGNNALERTKQHFSKELFTKALIKEINHYCNMLRKDI